MTDHRYGLLREAKMSGAVLCPGGPVVIREEAHVDLLADLLGIAPGPTHIAVVTADGARGYGMLGRHSETALRELDVLLDYHDATNEDANGRLAHEYQRPVAVASRQARDRWTREAIVDCVQAWHAAWGRPPRAHEWNARSAARWPQPDTVRRHFGSWSEAIKAAGYTPDRRGRPKKVAA